MVNDLPRLRDHPVTHPSGYAIICISDSVAQSGPEQGTLNPRVVGSNPTRITDPG